MNSKNLNALESFGWPIQSDWTQLLDNYFQTTDWTDLVRKVQAARESQTVFPSRENVFKAFELTPYRETRVVILGQDPYHGAGQAHGLCFSVLPGTKLPPSLRNILKELESDMGIPALPEKNQPANGCLKAWAQQGVFLLNTVLTVQESKANSHRKFGWHAFTDYIFQLLNKHPRRLVFVLWGKPAEKKRDLIDPRHHVLTAPHPSPLSAHRGFFGSKPFSRVNEILNAQNDQIIHWQIV